jgi:hypothetical protein
MSNIQGMIVRLETERGRDTGTDDRLYIGIFGKGGGSEFAIDVRNFDDAEPGANIKYWYGDVWDGTALTNAKKAYGADGRNDPAKRYIDIDKVDYVYIRKQSVYDKEGDDAWDMDEVEVALYGTSSPKKRVFHKTGNIWLANEYGLQVWLKEK